MPLFHTHIIVDWSARSRPSPKKPAKHAIWWAVARDGDVTDVVYARTRHAAVQSLSRCIADELSQGRRVLAGFDFPFGYPAGVARHLTGQESALALWAWLGVRIKDDERNGNNRYRVATEINSAYAGIGPFWGRPATWDFPAVPTGGRDRSRQDSHPPERRVADVNAVGAKTVWQLAYNGSVGSQVLLGVPALERLRNAPGLAGGVAVWPFESGLHVPDKPVVLAEVYPSLLKRAVDERAGENEIYDRAQMRVNAEAFASLDGRDALVPLFAGGAALTTQERDVVELEEGWILGLGHEGALHDALGSGRNAVSEAGLTRRVGSECLS